MDGLAKSLIRHPKTGLTVLDHARSAFSGKAMTVVVGFRAVQVMERHPDLRFIINPQWPITGSAFSLGIALSDEPSYIVSGDIFLDRQLIERLDQLGPNLVLTENRENRAPTSVHCKLNKGGVLQATYQGPVRSNADPEAIGLLKVSDSTTLRNWKKLCLQHGNLHAVQLLPCEAVSIHAAERKGEVFDEINSPEDYLRLIERTRNE